MSAVQPKPGFLTLRVSQEIIDWYERRAEENGTKRSTEIRTALEQYIKEVAV